MLNNKQNEKIIYEKIKYLINNKVICNEFINKLDCINLDTIDEVNTLLKYISE